MLAPMAAPQPYPVRIVVPVAWGDMDAFAHVNNTVYLRWFESARIAYFERMSILEPGAPKELGPILASLSCRFKAPLAYPDTVEVGVTVTEVGEDRFTMVYEVWSRALDRVAAKGEGLNVSYDYAAGRKAPLPAWWRDAIHRIEGR